MGSYLCFVATVAGVELKPSFTHYGKAHFCGLKRVWDSAGCVAKCIQCLRRLCPRVFHRSLFIVRRHLERFSHVFSVFYLATFDKYFEILSRWYAASVFSFNYCRVLWYVVSHVVIIFLTQRPVAFHCAAIIGMLCFWKLPFYFICLSIRISLHSYLVLLIYSGQPRVFSRGYWMSASRLFKVFFASCVTLVRTETGPNLMWKSSLVHIFASLWFF